MQNVSYQSIRALISENPAKAAQDCRLLLKGAEHDAEAYRLLGRALRALGQDAEAQQAELEAIDASIFDVDLREAALAIVDNRLEIAEPLLRARLRANPFDAAAIRMLAEVAGRLGRNPDAEKLLRRAVELAPGFVAARTNLATALHRQNKTEEALAELDRLNEDDPDSPVHANLRAAVLGRIGEFGEAIALYEDVLAKAPRQPKIWMSYGHALKTVGRQEESVAAYRRATELRPTFGDGWWSIANLKSVKLGQDDIAIMEKALEDPAASVEDRFHLHFALGKALDDSKRPVEAFAHYAKGNALRRSVLPYDAQETTKSVDAMISVLQPELLNEHEGQGCDAPDPIFIVGLPRAGSTLIEQILSSHSQVEGTMELPDIPVLVSEASKGAGYPHALRKLDASRLRELGEAYLSRTRLQRREGKPYFIDKLPNNWQHIGFIHMILPNAKIIDARRHPLDCGYSNFRQHYARGQAFSYDLADIGHFYANYMRQMAHIDHVLPGRVHRVIHEHLLDDPEGETRRLLDALGLPFEESCLRFHENRRAVRTASSEQVRRPINRDGAGQWQPVSEQLKPLTDALGDCIETYTD